ncbi:MAG: CSLREA domain-containing protein, partial [Solirubrobacteraceae bacterium]
MIASRSTLDLVRVCRIAALALGVVTWVPLVSPVAAAAATLTVTTTRDELVAHDGRCSLREAIEAVESPGTRTYCGRVTRGSNTIVLGPGRYVLSIPAGGVDDNTSGDLNVDGAAPLTIAGAGLRATVIDAGGLGDRVLSVARGARLVLSRLSIIGGRAPAGPAGASGVAGVGCAEGGAGADGLDAGAAADGGGIFNGGKLVLDTVAVTGNSAGAGGAGGSGGGAGCNGGDGGLGGGGGGVYNRGRLTLVDSTVSGNRAGAGGGGGSGDANPLGVSGAGGIGGPGGSGGGLENQGALSVT